MPAESVFSDLPHANCSADFSAKTLIHLKSMIDSAQVGLVNGLRAAAAFDRRQGQTRSDHQDGRSISAQIADRGMTAVLRSARRTKAPAFAWVNALLERRPARLVSVALANKAARIAWATPPR
jgi:hypothetical protein